MYSKSSQKRNWTLEADELIKLRVKNNQDFIVKHGSQLDVRDSNIYY
jgi:hypothetical protein